MVFALRSNSLAWSGVWHRHLSPALALALLLALGATSQVAQAKGQGGSKGTAQAPKDKAEDSASEPDESAEEGSAEASTEASTEASVSGPTGAAASLPGDSATMKPTIVFFDLGFRSDISLLYTRTTVGRFQEQEDFDVKSFGPMLHVGILTKMFWKLRIGAALGYGFNYQMTERLTEFEEEELIEPETWILGQIYTGDIRLEFSQELVDKLWLFVTPRGGLQAITPGEHLLRERESYEGAYNVRQGPQLGLIGGFEIGARYVLFDWLAVRASGGYDYYKQGLLKAKRKSDTVDYSAMWRMSGARVGGHLGVEALF